jgi:SAM-dependent methyltransferase
MVESSLYSDISRYYAERLRIFGASPQGVDWKDEASQLLRFNQLTKLLPETGDYLLLDYGCGYGALLDYLRRQGNTCHYLGVDVSEEMIETAARLHSNDHRARFCHGTAIPTEVDYILCSGVFNVRLNRNDEEWQNYLIETLQAFATTARRGFAFNLLTAYADKDKLRPDLYYADPCFLFAWVMREVSRHVVLLHDYPLYEFTLLVRKSPELLQ